MRLRHMVFVGVMMVAGYGPAMATLQVTGDSAPGDQCYQEEVGSRAMRVVKSSSRWVYEGGMGMEWCPEWRRDVTQVWDGHYTCAIRGGTDMVICTDRPENDACNAFGSNYEGVHQEGTWAAASGNRAEFRATYLRSDGYECKEEWRVTEYGCDAGYYSPSGTASSTMTCTRCPQYTDGTGNTAYGDSAIGNVSITSCYVSRGKTFSDSTGSGTFNGACYYN